MYAGPSKRAHVMITITEYERQSDYRRDLALQLTMKKARTDRKEET